MSLNTLVPQYDPFARMYNEYWGPRYCEDNIVILEKILLQHIPEKSHILDLCCGTGQLVQELILNGFEVTGIDASEGMLNYARQNAPSGQFILSDARSFDMPACFDAVVSTSASLNHIMNLEELTSVFLNIYQALKAKGIFVLEINLEEALKSLNFDKEGDVLDDYAWASISIYDAASKMGQIKMTLFAEQQGTWHRFDESWPLKGYSKSDIESVLKKAGFVNIQALGIESSSEVSNPSISTFFAAYKQE
ncbi:MAG: class I SAM-dependent methyltransferase [Acaryochloris sp. RU_4_1]|nr:class I SAM-dependent methyltransferase [Acaryochloris sp. RU_4_1]NJR53722.1 class I SAM-dependent methyltransferase [Acaryochloris sp. CRU_2_0]